MEGRLFKSNTYLNSKSDNHNGIVSIEEKEEEKINFVLGLDADNCILNEAHRFLFEFVVVEHLNFLLEIQQQKAAKIPVSDEQKDELKNIIETLEDFVKYDSKKDVVKINRNQLFQNKMKSEFDSLLLKHEKQQKNIDIEKREWFVDKVSNALSALEDLGYEYNIRAAILRLSNRSLFAYLEKHFSPASHKKIILVTMSNRQKKNDRFNATRNHTDLFNKTLPVLADMINHQFKEIAPAICTYDNLTAEQIYLEYNELIFFDKTKLTMLYLVSHYLLVTYGPSTFNYLEDDPIILGALLKVIFDSPQIIPKNIVVNVIPYDGQNLLSRDFKEYKNYINLEEGLIKDGDDEFPTWYLKKNSVIKKETEEFAAEFVEQFVDSLFKNIFVINGAGAVDYNHAENMLKLAKFIPCSNSEISPAEFLLEEDICEFLNERVLQKSQKLEQKNINPNHLFASDKKNIKHEISPLVKLINNATDKKDEVILERLKAFVINNE